MQKLAVQTDKLERSVNEVLLIQDQMIKLSQNCLKLEQEDDDNCEQHTVNMELSSKEKEMVKIADKKIASKNPFFKDLDLIFDKQNRASIQVALLKHEQKALNQENVQLKSMLRDYFHTLANSADLAGDGLLHVQKQRLQKIKKKKRRAKSSHAIHQRAR